MIPSLASSMSPFSPPPFPSSLSSHNFTPSTRELTISLDHTIAAELEKLKGEDDWNKLLAELLDLRRQKLEQEKPEPVKTESRYIPQNIQ